MLVLAVVSAATSADELDQARAAFRRGDTNTARRLLVPLADAGDLRAQYGLALMQFLGQGMAKDEREALVKIQKAVATLSAI